MNHPHEVSHSSREVRRSEKEAVHNFWQRASCGEELYLDGFDEAAYRRHSTIRYELEPYLLEFAEFEKANGKEVLEIGVGLGADHEKLAEAGAKLTGICLTERGIEHTRRRLSYSGYVSDLRVADAEHLPFQKDSFDLVYSWGVIHHTPDTKKAAQEILRVLKPGGRFKVMIYHRQSIVGYMLWLRYALLRGRPLTDLDSIYSRYLESPGTKAFSPKEGASLFAGAINVRTKVVLTQGDLLQGGSGQRHSGILLKVARKAWPRAIIKHLLKEHGLCLLIEGQKPLHG